MATTPIHRIAPRTFEAMQFDPQDMQEFTDWIYNYPTGTNFYGWANDTFTVYTGKNSNNDYVVQVVNPGDWIFKEFGDYWAVVSDTDFANLYEVVV